MINRIINKIICILYGCSYKHVWANQYGKMVKCFRCGKIIKTIRKHA